MKLQEFIENLKNSKKEITDMPALNPQKLGTCALCGKKFTNEKDIKSDVSGKLFHQECFDKATGNDILKIRRTDNQLPEGFDFKEFIAKKQAEKAKKEGKEVTDESESKSPKKKLSKKEWGAKMQELRNKGKKGKKSKDDDEEEKENKAPKEKLSKKEWGARMQELRSKSKKGKKKKKK